MRPSSELNLIKTDSITQKSSMFLFSLWDGNRGIEGPELPEIAAYNVEVLAKNGLTLDYSNEGIECRVDYTRMIEIRQYDEAKKLLKLYHK